MPRKKPATTGKHVKSDPDRHAKRLAMGSKIARALG
jgi:hypothetical protein